MRLLWLGLAVLLLARPAVAAAPLVVLDPGHGGEADGTKSARGTLEKTAALAIARYCRVYLQKEGVRVRLTRSDDRSLGLSARPALANRLDADAFVSIHLNHSPDPERRGWETYVLSAESSDELTARLLGREEGGGPAVSVAAGGSDLAFILGDLSRGVAHERSARLARAIQDAVEGAPALAPSRGLRQAPFTVLSGAEVPAVLVEVGYLSNAGQAEHLSSSSGQRAAAKVLARGIAQFLGR